MKHRIVVTRIFTLLLFVMSSMAGSGLFVINANESISPRVQAKVNTKGEFVEAGKDVHGNTYQKVERIIPGGLELTISTSPDKNGKFQKKTVITELEKSDHDVIEEFQFVDGKWKLSTTKKRERTVQK